jgi:RNA polymerase primary sigma factor
MTDSPDEALMRQYIADIARYPTMTDEEERQLLRAIERGAAARGKLLDLRPGSRSPTSEDLGAQIDEGEEVERRLVHSKLRFVFEIAKTYEPTGRTLLDLVQNGNLGLMRAIESFDWRTPTSFRDHIEAAVRDAIAPSGR